MMKKQEIVKTALHPEQYLMICQKIIAALYVKVPKMIL